MAAKHLLKEQILKEKIPYWRTSFCNGEVNSIALAIANEHVSQGPIVANFERDIGGYLGVPYVVATTSGSTALLMSLMAAGVRPGDEVIVPNRTWIATAHAPLLLGAKVVLVDVESERPILNADLVERAITEHTRAIIPVHMCGRAADMRSINLIAKKYNLIVVEDAAQALGSRNQDGYLGTQSDFGCFSLSVAKIISTGQGGFITTSSSDLYERLVAIRTHGVGDIINAVWSLPGFNFRFTDILASIGIVQLRLLPERLKKVQLIYKTYIEGVQGLKSIKMIPVSIVDGEIPIYIEILCIQRERLISFMASKGIQCRPFYPDLNYAAYFHSLDDFPCSIKFGRDGVYLPAGPEQPLSNIVAVIQALRDFDQSERA